MDNIGKKSDAGHMLTLEKNVYLPLIETHQRTEDSNGEMPRPNPNSLKHNTYLIFLLTLVIV